MKNTIALILCSLFVIIGCSNDDGADLDEVVMDGVDLCTNCEFNCLNGTESDVLTNDCIDDWECMYKLHPDSKVDLAAFHGQAAGSKNVFQFLEILDDDPLIIDDELAHVLVFELEANQTSFSAENEELENMNVHFRTMCYCPETEFKAVDLGCLQGELEDGNWTVQGNLMVNFSLEDFPIKFEAQFVD